MFAARLRTKLFVSIALVASGIGSALVVNGCTTEPWHSTFYCLPDANPEADIYGDCFPDAGESTEPLSCKAAGGDCVPMGTSDFRERAVLLWIGPEEEAPACPERASSVFYTGFADLSVTFSCAPCTCGPATCSLPEGISADPASLCQGANPTAYLGPTGWDGACVSPSVLSPGSFSSIELAPAVVSPCEASADPIPKPPGLRAGADSFANGVSWGKFAKACQGTAEGPCPVTGDVCLPSTEPPPPEFRQCVQYLLPVDEQKLPQCPTAFPERLVFYSGTEGEVDCSPCECGAPTDAQCAVSFSAYQDTACAGVPMPLFIDVPASAGSCIDFGGAGYSLGSMKAKWITNEPGTCEASGGELISKPTAVDPRVFCCQAPPPPQDQ